ncbi:MAG: dicarboxylate/amino acid:cation symporter [Rhizobiales bacterium]|nr:dicarboxylate/amino acid:cation symporter [Hyphomicrobiales bacterium]
MHHLKSLYVQVLLGIFIGVLLGHFFPDLGVAMQPFGTGFIKLIKMLIAPVIFLTVSIGIAKMNDLKSLGRVGLKSIVYFEVLTTAALAIGLLVANVWRPGAGFNADPAKLDAKSIASYQAAAAEQSTVDFFLNIIPNSVVDAFAKGDLLQILLFSILFGIALTQLGSAGEKILDLLEQLSQAFFKIVTMVMYLAPLGAFGAMAFTVGKFGTATLANLFEIMVAVYAACILFIFVVLNAVAWLSGFSLWRFIRYIRQELMLVLGTSSSEAALPRLMEKLEKAGCAKPVVGLVVPTGYSFNLDGTCIYLTMAALFIAQALNIPLSFTEQLTLLGILLLTSKGAAGVTGSGFIVLAATLSALHGKIPVEGVALILGVDRFMSEARALTNLIGNGVATMVVAKWENARDDVQMERALSGAFDAEEDRSLPLPAAV